MSKTKWKDMSASQRGLRLGGGIIILFLLIGIFVEPTEQTQKAPPPAREKVPTAEERAEAAFVEKHGRAPQRGLRGDYVEIRYHLREIAHDPKSVEIDRCTELQRTDAGWMTACRWRGANAFGAQRLAEHVFYVSNGRIRMVEM